MWQEAVMRLAQLDKFVWGERKRPLVRWLYEWMATHYDWGVEHLTPDYRRATHSLLDALQVTSQDRLLDLGCGTGVVTIPAAARAGQVIGLDLTPGMLRKLQRKVRQRSVTNVTLLHGDGRALPLRDGAVSVVTSSFMLPHLSPPGRRQLFRAACRVLERGGRVGFLTSLPRFGDIYLTEHEWRGWLAAAGFEEIKIMERFGVYRIVTAVAGGP